MTIWSRVAGLSANLRILLGVLLCVWGMSAFVFGLPERVKILGPLILISLGVLVVAGFKNLRRAVKLLQASYRAQVESDANARRLDSISKRFFRMGWVAYLLAMVWGIGGSFVFEDRWGYWVVVSALVLIGFGAMLNGIGLVLRWRVQARAMRDRGERFWLEE